jgi:hypothetical protein
MFSLRNEVLNYTRDSNDNLQYTQLNLFKVIAGLVVAISAATFLNSQNLNNNFQIASLVSSVLTLILSISYTREVIDSKANQNIKLVENIFSKTDETLKVIIRSGEDKNLNTFLNHAEANITDLKREPEDSYIGEIITFLFYLSVGFLILATYPFDISIDFISIHTFFVILMAYLLSFYNWSFRISKELSKKLFIKNK